MGETAMPSLFRAFQGVEHRPFYLEGGRPAALLVHGFPGTAAEMRPLGQVLHEAGWTAQGILLPGFGPDIGRLGERSAGDWLDAVQSAASDLGREHNPLLLVGNSMGAALALQAAATRPVDGLILLAPFWRLGGNRLLAALWPLFRRLVPQFKPFRLFKPDFSDARVRQSIREFLPGADLDDPVTRQAILDFNVPTRVIDQVLRSGQAGFDAAPDVAAPALILQGADDPVARPERTRALAARLSGACELQLFPAAHDLTQPGLPAWPDVREQVLAFAAQLAKPGR